MVVMGSSRCAELGPILTQRHVTHCSPSLRCDALFGGIPRQNCDGRYLWDLGQVIDHLRGVHGWRFIRRPYALGFSDSHGHLWYCFGCDTKLGKGHKSFRSDKAIWDHLNA
jgi:hypothetical protein